MPDFYIILSAAFVALQGEVGEAEHDAPVDAHCDGVGALRADRVIVGVVGRCQHTSVSCVVVRADFKKKRNKDELKSYVC